MDSSRGEIHQQMGDDVMADEFGVPKEFSGRKSKQTVYYQQSEARWSSGQFAQ